MYLLCKYNSNKSSASSSSTLKDELDDIVGDCIIKNSLPYNFVEDETFQSYTSILGKGTYSLPCISSFKTILNKRINMFFDSIKNEVSIISSSFERADGLPFPIVSLIHDTCTRKKLSVLGASICFISLDWKYKCKAICLIEINESKDSTYLASKIASLISQRFNWSISDILTAVSDTAASAQKISQTLLSNQGSLNHNNIKEGRKCKMHLDNLICDYVFGRGTSSSSSKFSYLIPEANALYLSIKKLVSYIGDENRLPKLKKIASDLGLNVYKPILDNVTRIKGLVNMCMKE